MAHSSSDIYRTMTETAARELESAMRAAARRGDPSSVALWSVPTTPERQGALVVACAMPAPGARVVRPCDNNASTWRSWREAPFSAYAHILWHACRREPILPVE